MLTLEILDTIHARHLSYRLNTVLFKYMIDTEGYRLNVGIIVVNPEQQVLWVKRVYHEDAWQFPQGGVNEHESAENAMYRELYEEVGLQRENVKLLANTQNWLCYRLPKRYLRKNDVPLCIGQKQKWFLIELCSSENDICLTASCKPEFNGWCWVDYWYPIKHVIQFKQKVYKAALEEFAPLVFNK